MFTLTAGRLRRHVVYAHLAGLSGRLAWRFKPATGGIETTLLRLMHLLPHKAAERCP